VHLQLRIYKRARDVGELVLGDTINLVATSHSTSMKSLPLQVNDLCLGFGAADAKINDTNERYTHNHLSIHKASARVLCH
jgi:hypothetical protein